MDGRRFGKNSPNVQSTFRKLPYDGTLRTKESIGQDLVSKNLTRIWKYERYCTNESRTCIMKGKVTDKFKRGVRKSLGYASQKVI